MKSDLIKCNIINAVLLGLIFILFFVTNIYIVDIGLFIWIIWFIYSNYVIVIQSSDICYQLKASDRYNNFNSQIGTLQRQYDSIMESESVIKDLNDANINRVYELASSEVINNINSSIKIIKVSGRQNYNSYRDEVDGLINENNDVIEKLNEVVKYTISIDLEVNSVDTSYINDILNSLRSVKNEQE